MPGGVDFVRFWLHNGFVNGRVLDFFQGFSVLISVICGSMVGFMASFRVFGTGYCGMWVNGRVHGFFQGFLYWLL